MSTASLPPATAVTAACIVVPKGCKPSKACGTDRTRMTLCHAYLQRHADNWWLCMSDSYIAVALKVEAKGEVVEGWVPIGALRLMEAGKPGMQVSPTAWKVLTDDGSLTFDCGDLGTFPDFAGLGVWTKPECAELAEVGMNTDLMAKIGLALGAKNGCRMQFVAPLRPIYVTPLRFDTGVAMQMPIRIYT
jgi:hypothetical protein